MGDKYFILLYEDGKLEFLNESAVAARVVKKELLGINYKGGDILARPVARDCQREDVITGEYEGRQVRGLAISLPPSVSERMSAGLQGRLYFDEKIGFNTKGKGQKVLGLVHYPDLKRGYLDTPIITDEELMEIEWVPVEGSSFWRKMQADGQYGPTVRYVFSSDKYIMEDGKEVVNKRAEDLLLQGWEAVMRPAKRGVKSDLFPDFKGGMQRIDAKNLVLVKKNLPLAYRGMERANISLPRNY